MKLKTNKINFFIFILVSFVLCFLLCLPTYNLENCLNNPGTFMPDLSRKIYNCFVQNNYIIKSLYYYLIYIIPEWLMLFAILINGVNMYYGFKSFKKKWWYYVILIFTLILSIILLDCYIQCTTESV